MTTTEFNTQAPYNSKTASVPLTDGEDENAATVATDQEVKDTASKVSDTAATIKGGGKGAAAGKPAEMDDLDDFFD
jgi:hypothetical protein